MASREEKLVLAQIKLMEEQERKQAARQKYLDSQEQKKKQDRPSWIATMQQELEDVKEFHPTEEEFREPMAYIRSIREVAAKYGTVKVVPPDSWKPSSSVDRADVPTNLQTVQHRVIDFEGGGVAFQTGFKKGHRQYTLQQYERLGEKRVRETLGEDANPKDEMLVEREFWNHVTTSSQFQVQYANDVEGTACRNDNKFGKWDLAKLPEDKRSLLQLVREEVPGVNTPMLYVGVLFAHFCWHYEDNALYSINYMHYGNPKTWYVVPGEYAGALEKAAKDIFSNHPDRKHPLMKHGENMLMRKTMMISPSLLKAKGVPVFRCTQRPRDFVITFPRSYHCGFNHGFHVGEAVNFALADWIPFGFFSLQRYRNSSSMSCMDIEKVICEMACRVAHCRVKEIMYEGLEQRECDREKKMRIKICRETKEVVATTFRQMAEWQLKLLSWAEQEGISVSGVEIDEDDPYDRQLCCACNHILHMSYVENAGNTSGEMRACPEHAEFLGPGELQLRVRYSKCGIEKVLQKLAEFPDVDLYARVPGEVNKKSKISLEEVPHRASYKVPPPRSPMFNQAKDKFPTLQALLVKEASTRIKQFRNHLLDIKPGLKAAVPELHAVMSEDLKKDDAQAPRSVPSVFNKRSFSSRTQSGRDVGQKVCYAKEDDTMQQVSSEQHYCSESAERTGRAEPPAKSRESSVDTKIHDDSDSDADLPLSAMVSKGRGGSLPDHAVPKHTAKLTDKGGPQESVTSKHDTLKPCIASDSDCKENMKPESSADVAESADLATSGRDPTPDNGPQNLDQQETNAARSNAAPIMRAPQTPPPPAEDRSNAKNPNDDNNSCSPCNPSSNGKHIDTGVAKVTLDETMPVSTSHGTLNAPPNRPATVSTLPVQIYRNIATAADTLPSVPKRKKIEQTDTSLPPVEVRDPARRMSPPTTKRRRFLETDGGESRKSQGAEVSLTNDNGTIRDYNHVPGQQNSSDRKGHETAVQPRRNPWPPSRPCAESEKADESSKQESRSAHVEGRYLSSQHKRPRSVSPHCLETCASPFPDPAVDRSRSPLPQDQHNKRLKDISNSHLKGCATPPGETKADRSRSPEKYDRPSSPSFSPPRATSEWRSSPKLPARQEDHAESADCGAGPSNVRGMMPAEQPVICPTRMMPFAQPPVARMSQGMLGQHDMSYGWPRPMWPSGITPDAFQPGTRHRWPNSPIQPPDLCGKSLSMPPAWHQPGPDMARGFNMRSDQDVVAAFNCVRRQQATPPISNQRTPPASPQQQKPSPSMAHKNFAGDSEVEEGEVEE